MRCVHRLDGSQTRLPVQKDVLQKAPLWVEKHCIHWRCIRNCQPCHIVREQALHAKASNISFHCVVRMTSESVCSEMKRTTSLRKCRADLGVMLSNSCQIKLMRSLARSYITYSFDLHAISTRCEPAGRQAHRARPGEQRRECLRGLRCVVHIQKRGLKLHLHYLHLKALLLSSRPKRATGGLWSAKQRLICVLSLTYLVHEAIWAICGMVKIILGFLYQHSTCSSQRSTNVVRDSSTVIADVANFV